MYTPNECKYAILFLMFVNVYDAILMDSIGVVQRLPPLMTTGSSNSTNNNKPKLYKVLAPDI